jgi:hypothetical protein
VCFLLGVSPASALYWPTFQNILYVPSSRQMIWKFICLEDGTDRMFRNVDQYKPGTGKHPKENTLNTEHGESLKSMIIIIII